MSMIVETLVVELKETGGKKAASGLKKVAVASAGVYAAYKLISKGLKVVNDAWKVQEKSLIKVRSALKAQGLAVTRNTKDMETFTAALQAQTNIGDEVTLSLVAQALAMGATAEEARTATEAALGLSESLGLGVQQSLRAVTNAQEGNFESLQRYIPALKGVTDDTEAWNIINQSAEAGLLSLGAQTETMAGKMTRISNAFGDYFEQIGRGIADNPHGWMSRLGNAIEETTAKLTRHNDVMQQWNKLTRQQKKDMGGLSGFTATFNDNVERAEYYTARLAAATVDYVEVADEAWKPEKSRAYWQEYTAGVLAAHENLTVLEQIEQDRLIGLAQANTEFADYNQLIRDQVNLSADLAFAAEMTLQNEKALAEEKKLVAILDKESAEAAALADEESARYHANEMQRIRVQKDAIMSMYSSMRDIVSMYYENEIAAAGDNEEELARIREKQFRVNKAFAIADTIINTSQSIMKVLAQGGIFAVPLSIAIGALGAAQVAMIASTQPGFADGTPPGGYTVPSGYNDDSFPVSAKSGETVNITRAGESDGDLQQVTIMLDGQVLASTMTDLIGRRQVVIKQGDIVA